MNSSSMKVAFQKSVHFGHSQVYQLRNLMRRLQGQKMLFFAIQAENIFSGAQYVWNIIFGEWEQNHIS